MRHLLAISSGVAGPSASASKSPMALQ